MHTGRGDVDIDLQHLARALADRWRLILAVTLVATLAAFVFAWSATPLYQAETRILIELRESTYTRNAGSMADDAPIIDDEGVTSQVEIVGSSDILRQVAEELELTERAEFRDGGILAALGLSGGDAAGALGAAVDIMREKLSVFRVEDSRVIVVRFSSEDPELAARVPNAIAETYIEEQRQAKIASNTNATEWLAPEIADLRDRVREAEAAVAAFRADSDLLLVQNDSTLNSQQLSELSSELSDIRARRATAEARAAGVRVALESGASLASVPEVLESPIIQRLRERQVQLNAEIADLSTTLLEDHPRMQGLRSQLDAMSARIRDEAENVLESLQNEAAAARRSEAQLREELDAVKAASAEAGTDAVELRALEREAAAQRQLLESYLTRYREASARADRNYLPVDARIFSRAMPPLDPYYPKFGPILAATFLGSLLLMAIGIMLSELFTGRAMRAAPLPAEVEPVPSIVMPAAAAAPAGDGEHDHDDHGEEVMMETGGSLSVPAAAQFLMGSGASRAVFLSPEGEEASAASVMVARELADAGVRVVFLDLTFTGTPSNLMLDGRSHTGITNLLAAEAQFTETIHGDLYSECHVIPVGTADARRAMRAADRLPIILTSLTTAYDLVVIECGPADAASIRRVVSDDTQVLLGALEPGDEKIAQAGESLGEAGYRDVVRVTPGAGRFPPAEPRGAASAS